MAIPQTSSFDPGDDLPALVVGYNRRALGMLIPNTSATPHTSSSSDTSVSTTRDTCIPTLYGLNFLYKSFLASCAVNFERFSARMLSHIPGIVKLRESPGKAGGLLRGI